MKDQVSAIFQEDLFYPHWSFLAVNLSIYLPTILYAIGHITSWQL